jgi:glutamate formiminotransferase
VLECVINISEGRDLDRVTRIAAHAESALLDVHTDPHHNRSVLTVVGEDAPRAVATTTIAELDLRFHDGVHPRLGVLDVVPFVALEGSTDAHAVHARDAFARWLGDTHRVPCFLYGPERSLPEVRREAFGALAPDTGPPLPHPTAGATAVGQRGLLVAYNVWLDGTDLATVRRIAAHLRSPEVRTLGLRVGGRLQLSMNLTKPAMIGPAMAYDRVVASAAAIGMSVDGAELVGLIPRAVLRAVPEDRWGELDLSEARTIEARLDAGRPGSHARPDR